MNPSSYTYRNGQKVSLKKRSGQFVIRARGNRLRAAHLPIGETMSPASERVSCTPGGLERLMSKARSIAPTHHAYDLADSGEEFLLTDRIFVTFKDTLPSDDVAVFAGQYGLVEIERFSDRDYLFQLTDQTGMNPIKLVVKLTEEVDLVEMAENDLNHRMARLQDIDLPNDSHYLEQWHLHTHRNHPEVDQRSSSQCEQAWEVLGHFGSPEVVVGVTDDGCRLDHRDFDSAGKFAGWGYFDGPRLITDREIDADPERMYERGANHGTSCCGVIAAETDGFLTVGAAPGSRLLPIKWESDGPFLLINDAKLLRAINYLAEKVDIVSNSWGGGPISLYPQILINRITALSNTAGRRGRGILFLWAAGNENRPINHTADIEVPYTSGFEVRNGSFVWVDVKTTKNFRNSLADVPGVMHVAALASNARRSHYSNYGPGIDIAAPSNNRHAYHRMGVGGLGVVTTTGEPVELTRTFGGTSSATPLVAGIAALVISANPRLSAAETQSILKRTAWKDLSADPYPRTPPAIYDHDTGWDVSPVAPFNLGDFQDIDDPDGSWSPWFGHGRVNAAAAVAEALLHADPDDATEMRFESTPNVTIPDNTPGGITDVIDVTARGRIANVKVSVDIEHSWIGDLRVMIIASNGATIVLHDRHGGGGQNLLETYDATRIPTLAGLLNTRIEGEWTLKVEDTANRDEGRLSSWSLEFDVAPDTIVVEDDDALGIPDDDPAGISRVLSVPGDPTITDLAVSVDITHTWIGDLQVSLTPPSGTPILLHDRRGGSNDNIVRTWHTTEFPGLDRLRGHTGGGHWTLTVADRAGHDVGKLNSWGLEITT